MKDKHNEKLIKNKIKKNRSTKYDFFTRDVNMIDDMIFYCAKVMIESFPNYDAYYELEFRINDIEFIPMTPKLNCIEKPNDCHPPSLVLECDNDDYMYIPYMPYIDDEFMTVENDFLYII